MNTFLIPDSKNFLEIALFSSGSGSLMSRIDRQIFRNSPPPKEFSTSLSLFGWISSIKSLKSLQKIVGYFECSEVSFVCLLCNMPTDAFQRNPQLDGLSHSFHRDCAAQLTSVAAENSNITRENLGSCTT